MKNITLSRRTIHKSGKIFSLLLLLVFWTSLFQPGCRYYNLERKLDPVNADWFNRVRYIMTRDEEKIFLDLPISEKDKFKEDFWKRRDPSPDTEENEFKMEYFDRVERSDKLFRSEGIPGYKTDRGRIYILFGEPMQRLTYPMGTGGICREMWYYGNFPIVFVDRNCTGKYNLVTYDLTPLRTTNLQYMQDLTNAQAHAQQTIHGKAGYFNFDWKVDKTLVQPDRVEGIIIITLSYANIWFRENDDTLETELTVHSEIRDSNGMLVWQQDKTFPIKTDSEELGQKKEDKLRLEIPFSLTSDLDRLFEGKNKILVNLKNKTGNDERIKVMDFSLK